MGQGRIITEKPIRNAKQFVKAYERHGSIKAVARATKQAYKTVHAFYVQALAENLMSALPRGNKTREHLEAMAKGTVKAPKPVIGGTKKAIRAKPLERPEGGISRYLFTCAQNNTKLHEGLWENILKLKEFYNAELHISRFAYIQSGLGARGNKAAYFANVGTRSGKQDKSFWFDERIVPYISDERRTVAPGLVWCGEANILPTAARPLSSLETLTGRASSIVPHVKIAMESIPSALLDPVKFNYTTGTVTQRNYIQRKEGLKADFHHCYGALLVEVENATGDWWCRQLNADSDGTLYDIDICVSHGVVTTTNIDWVPWGAIFVYDRFVEGIKWGDVHERFMDPAVRKSAWGRGGMLDHLKPRYQFLDDTLDFFARNHHEIDDPIAMYGRYVTGHDGVEAEAKSAVEFVRTEAMRPWCETVVVNSNHDRAGTRWLKNKTVLHDARNVAFWARMNDRFYSYITREGKPPVFFQEAYLEVTGRKTVEKGLRFLKQDETFIICPHAGGGVENGQHGDDGPNGRPGTSIMFAKLGRKMNRGHSHTAGIWDSVYGTGTCHDLKHPPHWQHGPSGWSNSHVVTYRNGKRQIITMWGEDRKPWATRTV